MSLSASLSRCSIAVLAAVAVAAAGCSSSTTDTTSGGIALSVNPASTSVTPSGALQVSGTITRPTGFTGDVTIAITGLPTGVTASVTTQPTNGGSSFVATVNIGSAVAAGTYHVTVTASGSGVTSSSVTFTFTVSSGGSGTGTMTATVDGHAWSGTVLRTVSYTSSTLVIEGFDGTDLITLTMSPITSSGTYTLNYNGTSAYFADGVISNSVGGWGTGFVGGTGSLTLTTLTANHVVGSFSFTAMPGTSGATGTRVVTGGAFDLTF